MKGTRSCNIVSNYWRISSALIALILLFLGTEAAANSIRTASAIYPCLDKLLERATERAKQRVIKIPIPSPDPEPFLIGCLTPGCDLAATGPLELIIELNGDLLPSALLEIDGLSPDQRRMLQFRGGIQVVPDQQSRFKLEQGQSRISGLRVELGKRISTEDLVTRLMERTAAQIIPTVQLRLSVDADEAEKWVSRKSQPKIVVDLKIIQGKTTINQSRSEYTFIHCEDGSKPPPPPVDWIHVTEQVGVAVTDFADDAVALVNGRIRNGSTTPPLTTWIKPRAYKGRAIFPMPQNIWSYDSTKTTTDEGGCSQPELDIYTNNHEPCWPEVSVFAHDRAMTLKRITEWTDNLGDQVPVSVKGPGKVLKVPVNFYIHWENHTPGPVVNPGGDPCLPADSTYCLAQTHLTDAREFFSTNMMSGIDFDIKLISPESKSTNNTELIDSACANRYRIQELLGLVSNPTSPPTKLWVYFVRTTREVTPSGPLIHNAQTCTEPAFARDIDLPTDVHPAQLNEIFMSTSMTYNATTLAHEFGHALSLDDVNKSSTTPKSYAMSLSEDNLMWSGSSVRDKATIAQMFRMNINKLSAVHRLNAEEKVLDPPRFCLDFLRDYTCPELGLTP